MFDCNDHFIVLSSKEYFEFVTRIGWSSDSTSNQYLVKTAKRVKKITSIKINGVDMVRYEEGD